MEERDIFFESINIEPSKIYTNSKFKLKIKVIGTSRILTEDNNVLNTENNEKLVFLEMFHKDEEALLTQGIREEDIPLMLDLL